MKNDLISVIVPVYNVPHKMLRKCLESLDSQTYENIEVIVVDDGSTDKTCSNICEEYKENKKFKIFHKKNGGLCSARNFGVYKSSGKWITFVDGDDWIEKTCFETIINKIKNDDIDIVMFGTIKEYKNKNFKYHYRDFYKDGDTYTNNDINVIRKDILNFDANLSDVTAKLYRLSFIIDNNIFHDESIRQGIEAIDFNVRAFSCCKKTVFLNDYFYHYAYNEKSITNNFNESEIRKNLYGYYKLRDYLLKNNESELLNMLYVRIMHNIISVAISGYFNPKNKMKFKKRKIGFNSYLEEAIVKESLINVDHNMMNFKYRIILFFIKNKTYLCLYLLGYIRNFQKG